MEGFIAPGHERWEEFVGRLEGPEGCFIRTKDDGGLVWDCFNDHTGAKRVLRAMGCSDGQIDVTLEYCRRHGGYCDCEILMNVGTEKTRT
jgi:hypothetical protein